MRGADDPVHPQDAQAHVGDVQRAAVALAVAGGLVGDFGQHAAQVAPFGDQVAVAAVRAGDVVVLAQGVADPDGNRLLAHVEVGHAAKAPGQQQVLDLRLPEPDLEHVFVHADKLLLGQFVQGARVRTGPEPVGPCPRK